MTTPTLVTQKQRIHEHLKLWGSLCVADLPLELSYTARNRISELRRDGVPIRTATCGWHRHEHPVARYYLEQPQQQALAL
jgi:hypothetical protein